MDNLCMNNNYNRPDDNFGDATARMTQEIFSDGVDRAVLLMRHSAREYRRDIHDLENPLTAQGRDLASRFGARLPDVDLRGYSSPVKRCTDTAVLAIEGSAAASRGGVVGEVRDIEAFGVFYALDQIRMWKGLREAGGLANYVGSWFAGEISQAALMRPQRAVSMVLEVMLDKLKAPAVSEGARQLDLCVTHDMTIFTMRHGSGLEPVDAEDVKFMDGLLMFEKGNRVYFASQHGGVVEIDEALLAHSR
jgi:hypothetical protein